MIFIQRNCRKKIYTYASSALRSNQFDQPHVQHTCTHSQCMHACQKYRYVFGAQCELIWKKEENASQSVNHLVNVIVANAVILVFCVSSLNHCMCMAFALSLNDSQQHTSVRIDSTRTHTRSTQAQQHICHTYQPIFILLLLFLLHCCCLLIRSFVRIWLFIRLFISSFRCCRHKHTHIYSHSTTHRRKRSHSDLYTQPSTQCTVAHIHLIASLYLLLCMYV